LSRFVRDSKFPRYRTLMASFCLASRRFPLFPFLTISVHIACRLAHKHVYCSPLAGTLVSRYATVRGSSIRANREFQQNYWTDDFVWSNKSNINQSGSLVTKSVFRPQRMKSKKCAPAQLMISPAAHNPPFMGISSSCVA